MFYPNSMVSQYPCHPESFHGGSSHFGYGGRVVLIGTKMYFLCGFANSLSTSAVSLLVN